MCDQADSRETKEGDRGKAMKQESCEGSFREHDAAVRGRALKEFRRRGFRRRMANGGVAVAVVSLLLTIAFRRADENRNIAAEVQLEAPIIQISNTGQGSEERLTHTDAGEEKREEAKGELSDEQLLTIFPEGSCFIAEVNGKKILVFRDAEVRAQFFN